MKKILPLIILFCLSCSKGEKETFWIDQHVITIHHNETSQLTTTPPQLCTWSTYDNNIATVSTSGLVTGIFIGDTKIDVKSASGNFTDFCMVHTAALSLLYSEPYFVFKASIDEIKLKEKRTLYHESSTALIFNGENPNVRNVIYIFDINGLASAAILLNNTSAVISELEMFLDERYPFVGITQEVAFYQGANGTIIAVSVDDTLGLNVMYLNSDSGKKGFNSFDEYKKAISKMILKD